MTSASDGLVEWRGTAGQVRVGHLVQGMKKTKNDVWEVIETRLPAQVEYGYTLWWRVVNKATGEMAAIPPKSVKSTVIFMLTPEEVEVAERTGAPPPLPQQWPSNSDEVALLVQELGAEVLAHRDRETGEIYCPAYGNGAYHSTVWRPGVGVADELEHLRIAHGIDVSALEGIVDPAERLRQVVTEHGRLHGPRSNTIVHRGFPHRHVPEDLSLM